MFTTAFLLSTALAQEPVLPPELPVPVVDIVSDRAARRAEGMVIGGRATFVTGAVVLGTSAAILGATLPAAMQVEVGGNHPSFDGVGIGAVGVGLGVLGMLVGGTVWGAGEAQQHRLQVGVAPTGNGLVVAGRF